MNKEVNTKRQRMDEVVGSGRQGAKSRSSEIECKRSTNDLWLSEAQYRTTLDSMGDAVVVVDADLRIRLFNLTFKKWNEELDLETEVIGRNLFEIFPFLPERVRDEYRWVLENGEVLITEESTVVGSKKFITDTRKIPVFEEGKVARIVTVIRDISKRKRAEQALRDSEQKYRMLVETMTEGLGVQDENGLLVYANSRLCDMLGYSADELIGQAVTEFLAEDSKKTLEEQMARRKRGKEDSYELEWIRKDGQKISTIISPKPTFDKDGRFTGSFGVVTDITARKRTEERIGRTKALLQSVVDGISEPLIMFDKNLRVRMLNEAALKYYELGDYQDAIGKLCHDAFNGRPFVCDECYVPSVLSGGDSRTFERKGFKDPERIELVTVYRVQGENGEVRGCVLRISDITEQKEVEKQLIRADRLSSLGQLSGGIAHEIRNPLSGISLFLDVLYDNEQFERTDKELEILEEMRKGITKIDGIIKRILNFARESADLLARLDLNSLTEETLKLWYSELSNKEIKLILSLEEDLPTVFADSIGIMQVLNNLVQNAVEAMAGGGVLEISTQRGVSSLRKDRPIVTIQVRDTGRGITPEEQEKIFNPFFSTKPTGTGLGLAISHQIIKRHGGIISLESKPDEATTFVIELPAPPKN